MLKVVMIELGDALFDEHERPRAHVAESIETMTRMLTQVAEPLAVVAIAEVAPDATPDVHEQRLLAVVAQLERAGLRALFEPVARRLTLCARSPGGQTPDRVCIDTALRQLGAAAGVEECALVTAGAARGLCFGRAAGPRVDFDDWRQLPLLVAAQLDTERLTNTTLALRGYWAQDAGIEVIDVAHAPAAGALNLRVRRWLPVVDPRLGVHSGVLVPFEVTGRIDRAPDGRVLGVAFSEPSQEDVLEAAEWIASLAHHGQLAADATSRGTHVIELDAKGNRRLIRRGYSR